MKKKYKEGNLNTMVKQMKNKLMFLSVRLVLFMAFTTFLYFFSSILPIPVVSLAQSVEESKTNQITPIQSINEFKKNALVYFIAGDGYSIMLKNTKEAINSYEKSLNIYQSINDRVGIGITLYRLGNVRYSIGEYEKAIELYQESLAIQRELGDISAEIRLLAKLGDIYLSLDQHPKAIEFYEKSLAKAKGTSARKTIAISLIRIGMIYYIQENYQNADQIFKTFNTIYKDILEQPKSSDEVAFLNVQNNSELKALFDNELLNYIGVTLRYGYEAYTSLGRYLFSERNNFFILDRKEGYENIFDSISADERLLKYINQIPPILSTQSQRDSKNLIFLHQKFLSAAKTIQSPIGEASSINNLGNIYFELLNYGEAINYFEQSLKLLKDTNSYNNSTTANVLNNLGRTYQAMGQFQKAIDYFEQSIILSKKVGNKKGEVNSLSLLGVAYFSLSQYQKAIDYHQQAIVISKSIGDRKGTANILNSLGRTYSALGQYKKAKESYEQALTLVNELEDREDTIRTLNNLGSAYYFLGQYQEAIEFYRKALLISVNANDRNGIAETSINLGKLLPNFGQTKDSIDILQEALTIKREIGDRDGEGKALTPFPV